MSGEICQLTPLQAVQDREFSNSSKCIFRNSRSHFVISCISILSTVDEDAEDVIGEVDSSLVLNVKRGGVWGTLVKTPLQRTVDVVDDLSELAGRYVNIEKPGRDRFDLEFHYRTKCT